MDNFEDLRTVTAVYPEPEDQPEFITICFNRLPALLAELDAALAEASRLREALISLRPQVKDLGHHFRCGCEQCEANRNGVDIDEILAANQSDWLASRDAEQRRLGAAEWLDTCHRNNTAAGRKQFSVESCWLWFEAQRMREGGE